MTKIETFVKEQFDTLDNTIFTLDDFLTICNAINGFRQFDTNNWIFVEIGTTPDSSYIIRSFMDFIDKDEQTLFSINPLQDFDMDNVIVMPSMNNRSYDAISNKNIFGIFINDDVSKYWDIINPLVPDGFIAIHNYYNNIEFINNLPEHWGVIPQNNSGTYIVWKDKRLPYKEIMGEIDDFTQKY